MKGMKSVGKYGSIGFELLASIGIGYYGGLWLDRHFHTGYIRWIGFVVGVYTGFKALFRLAKQMEEDVAKQEALDRGEDPWADEHDTDDDAPAPTRDEDDAPAPTRDKDDAPAPTRDKDPAP